MLHVSGFYTFCAEYELHPASIAFDTDHIFMPTDAAGVPLEGIRTVGDSTAV